MADEFLDQEIEVDTSREAELETNWVTFVDKQIENHPVTTSRHPKMALYKAFYEGHQYKTLDEYTNQIRDVAITRETKSITNISEVFINLWAAKMMEGNPYPQITPFPDNVDDDIIKISKVSNGAVRSWWKTQKMRQKLGRCLKWGGVTGAMWGRILWDVNAGDNFEIPTVDLFGNEEAELISEGDVTFEVLNPFQMFPNPEARDAEDLRYVVHQFPKAKSVVEDAFDLPRDSLNADDMSSAENQQRQARIDNDIYYREGVTKEADVVLIKELWMKASKQYPRGKHVVVVNKRVLVNEDNPRPWKLPFVYMPVREILDEFWGQGYMEKLVPLNREYNKTNSLIIENMIWSGNNKWMVERGSGVKEHSLTDQPGEVVEYDMVAPQQSQAAPLPHYIVAHPDDIFRRMQQAMNIQDPSMGMIPHRGSQTSGTVVRELKESEKVFFSEDMSLFKKFVEEIITEYLSLAKNHYELERFAKVLGANRKPEIIKFSQADFVKNYNIDINVGEGFSVSPSVRFDQIMQMWEQKVIQDPAIVMRAVSNFGTLEKVADELLKDEKKAEYTLDAILSARTTAELQEASELSPYDNHDVHIRVFTDFIKEPRYRELGLTHRTVINQYINICYQKKYEMQMMQQQIMMQSQMLAAEGQMETGARMKKLGGQQSAMDKMVSEENLHLAQGQPMTGTPDSTGG